MAYKPSAEQLVELEREKRADHPVSTIPRICCLLTFTGWRAKMTLPSVYPRINCRGGAPRRVSISTSAAGPLLSNLTQKTVRLAWLPFLLSRSAHLANGSPDRSALVAQGHP